MCLFITPHIPVAKIAAGVGVNYFVCLRFAGRDDGLYATPSQFFFILTLINDAICRCCYTTILLLPTVANTLY